MQKSKKSKFVTVLVFGGLLLFLGGIVFWNVHRYGDPSAYRLLRD